MDAQIVGGLLRSEVAGIALFDHQLLCIQANAEMARLAATTPEALLGRTPEQIVGRDWRDELAAIAEVLATGRPSFGRAIDGAERQLRLDYLPVGANGNRGEGVAIVAVDASAQKRAEQALTERLGVAQLISELSASFIDLEASQIDSGIERAMEVISDRLGIDGTHVGQLYEDDRESWHLTHQWVRQGAQTPSIGDLQRVPTSRHAWSSGRILSGVPTVVADLAELPPEAEPVRQLHSTYGVRAVVTIPLVMNRAVEGFVSFTSATPREWSPEVLASLRLTTEILANALDRKRNEGALTERLAFEEALSQIATRFIAASSDAIDGAIEEALRILAETLRYERTAVFLLDEPRTHLGLRYEWRADGVPSFRDSMAGLPIKEFGWPVEDIVGGKVVNIDWRALPPGAEQARRVLERDGFATLSTVPMRIEGVVIGCVGFHSRTGRSLDGPLVARMQLVGDIISGALARRRAELARRQAFAELETLKNQAERERDYLREEAGSTRIVGASPGLKRLLDTIEVVAATGATVLIRGESGVGKELFARSIHERSPRRSGALVKVNCASVPKELFESEFFGHVRGAFTGAFKDRAGRFELADGGTLFLDEIGDIPLDLQAKLLRVLQESEFERVGDDRTRKVDVRIVAATNRNLEADVLAGRFRQDLYYRLSVFPLEVPPLRARRDDILPLAEHFLRLCSAKLGRPELALDRAHREMLVAYEWPGNVRELQHVIERAVILSPAPPLRLERALLVGAPAGTTAPVVAAPTSMAPLATVPAAPMAAAPMAAAASTILTDSDLRALERDSIAAALERAAGRIAGPGGAAELLGMRPSTLRDRMKALGIAPRAIRTTPAARLPARRHGNPRARRSTSGARVGAPRTCVSLVAGTRAAKRGAVMTTIDRLGRLFGAPKWVRLVLQCRGTRDLTLCEDIAFAFARDAGMPPLDMWYVGACAYALGRHVLERGGGELELAIVDEPRVAVQLRALCSGRTPSAMPPDLETAKGHADELDIAWRPGVGSIITARRWLRAAPAA